MCVTIETLMWSCYVIVPFHEFSKQPFKMALAKHYHMIEHLSPQCSNESLHEWILPRTSICSANFCYATAFQKSSYAVAIDSVVVAEQIFWLQSLQAASWLSTAGNLAASTALGEKMAHRRITAYRNSSQAQSRRLQRFVRRFFMVFMPPR